MKAKKSKKITRRGSRKAITRIEYARRLGLHKSSVYNAAENGLIVLTAAGLVDPQHPANKNYEASILEKKQNHRRLTKKDLLKNYATMPALDIEEELKNFPPASLKELKTYSEIQKIVVDIQDRLKELIPREMIEERMQTMSREIDMFDALADTVAVAICARLGCPDRVEAVKAIISPEVKKIIENFKTLCQKKI